jgi:hypothetical protein
VNHTGEISRPRPLKEFAHLAESQGCKSPSGLLQTAAIAPVTPTEEAAVTDLRLMPTSSSQVRQGSSDLRVVADLAIVAEAPESGHSPAAARLVMGLLGAGVPLSLLFDLADPDGPPSADMLSSEQDGGSLVGELLAFRAEAAQRRDRDARHPQDRTLRLG